MAATRRFEPGPVRTLHGASSGEPPDTGPAPRPARDARAPLARALRAPRARGWPLALLTALVLALVQGACVAPQRDRAAVARAAQPIEVCQRFQSEEFIRLPLDSECVISPNYSHCMRRATWRDFVADYGAEFVPASAGWPAGWPDVTQALQHALDDLRVASQEVADPNASTRRVALYLPAGDYVVSRTLLLRGAIGIQILGESPRTTRLHWGGDRDRDMLVVDQTHGLRLSRLTFDGANAGGNVHARAAVRWIQTAQHCRCAGVAGYGDWRAADGICVHGRTEHRGCDPEPAYSSSNHEYSDDYFQNLGYGVVVGSAAPCDGNDPACSGVVSLSDGVETPHGVWPGADNGSNAAGAIFRRDRFTNVLHQALVVSKANGLQLHVWDSTFDECNYGIVNVFIGAFQIWHNVFLGSRGADIDMRQPGGMSLVRENYSLRSRQFLITGAWNHEPLEVVGNTVVGRPSAGPEGNPGWSPIRMGYSGSVLVDNHIHPPAGIAPVYFDFQACPGLYPPNTDDDVPDITMVGNALWGAAAFAPGTASCPAHTVLADPPPHAQDEPYTAPPMPILPDLPPLSTREVVTVVPVGNADDDSAALQDAIDLAPDHSVVHVVGGLYRINRTIDVPGGKDVIIVGDGAAGGARTTLYWQGVPPAERQADYRGVLRFVAPARGGVQDVMIQLDPNGHVVDGATVPYDRATGVIVDTDDDDARGFVYGTQVTIQGAQDGVFMDDLDRVGARFEWLRASAGERAMRVRGHGAAATGACATRGLQAWGGEFSGTYDSFVSLENWGRAVVDGTWSEMHTQGLHLGDSGYLTFSQARVASWYMNVNTAPAGQPSNALSETTAQAFPDAPNFVIEPGFRGRASLVNLSTGSGVYAAGNTDARVLVLGHFQVSPFLAGYVQPSPAPAPPNRLPDPGCGSVTLEGGGNALQMALHSRYLHGVGFGCANQPAALGPSPGANPPAAPFVTAGLEDLRVATTGHAGCWPGSTVAPPDHCIGATAITLRRVVLVGHPRDGLGLYRPLQRGIWIRRSAPPLSR